MASQLLGPAKAGLHVRVLGPAKALPSPRAERSGSAAEDPRTNHSLQTIRSFAGIVGSGRATSCAIGVCTACTLRTLLTGSMKPTATFFSPLVRCQYLPD